MGRVGGPSQTVYLGRSNCMHKGIAMHEFMHTIGFYHEQSRSDRDEHIRILSENFEGGGQLEIC